MRLAHPRLAEEIAQPVVGTALGRLPRQCGIGQAIVAVVAEGLDQVDAGPHVAARRQIAERIERSRYTSVPALPSADFAARLARGRP